VPGGLLDPAMGPMNDTDTWVPIQLLKSRFEWALVNYT
jgi:hypothetical protein